jgi:hypothetical protein
MSVLNTLLSEFVSPEMRRAKTVARNEFATALQNKLDTLSGAHQVKSSGRFSMRVFDGTGKDNYQIRVRANSMWIDKEGGHRLDLSGSNDAMLTALACIIAHGGI